MGAVEPWLMPVDKVVDTNPRELDKTTAWSVHAVAVDGGKVYRFVFWVANSFDAKAACWNFNKYRGIKAVEIISPGTKHSSFKLKD